jgi:hypothetical protein
LRERDNMSILDDWLPLAHKQRRIALLEMLHYEISEDGWIESKLTKNIWNLELCKSFKAFHFPIFVDCDSRTKGDCVH